MALWTSSGWPRARQRRGGRCTATATASRDCWACRAISRNSAIPAAANARRCVRPRRSCRMRPGRRRLQVDYGRCVVCQLCTEACPTGAMAPSGDWAFGVRRREDLVWAETAATTQQPRDAGRRAFRRSLHIRHVDAGSCNGCELELQALNNPFYNLHRLGVFFTPSPRFADLLLVTGPVTHAMREPLLATYNAMPEPRWVMAVGTCAVSGGISAGGYACGTGLEGVLPVDVYLPGCPPNPAAIMKHCSCSSIACRSGSKEGALPNDLLAAAAACVAHRCGDWSLTGRGWLVPYSSWPWRIAGDCGCCHQPAERYRLHDRAAPHGR